jgi:hypothetical protein
MVPSFSSARSEKARARAFSIYPWLWNQIITGLPPMRPVGTRRYREFFVRRGRSYTSQAAFPVPCKDTAALNGSCVAAAGDVTAVSLSGGEMPSMNRKQRGP